MRKPDFCLCENKDADQICACVFATQSTISLLKSRNFKLLACCDCTGRFMSDLVGNNEDLFSRIVAQR